MNTNKIVVVGGGSSGWMTAATLIKAFPNKNISVIESKDVPIIGVGESTLGGIKRWTRFIGIDESSFFSYTDASLKLSIKFTDFYKKNYGSFHYPFGNPININNRNPFFDWHLKKYFYPKTPINDFTQCLFPASALYENNKFSLNKYKEFDNFNPKDDVAYHFDAVKFGNWLREKYCIPSGVKHIIGTVVDIKTNKDGIECLILDTKEKIDADLYIDCTGFKSILLSGALKEPFDDYSNMLPNNKAWATRLEYKDRSKELEGFTNSTAIENGWCWNIPLWSRLGTGYVYSDKFVDPEDAKKQFKNYLMSKKMIIPRNIDDVENLEFKDISMRVGIHKKTFVKNVVAIGLSAGFIEPLESNGLFSVHEFLFKLVDILQRGQISQFDRDIYNVTVKDIFDNFSKFVAMHYSLSHRKDTEYWNSIFNKNFTDHNLDPYSQSIKRTDSFYNLAWRYMENWEHPFGLPGITYISTGMNLMMMNLARIEAIEHRENASLKKYIDKIILEWELKKQKWKQESKKSLNLEFFLKQKFYFN